MYKELLNKIKYYISAYWMGVLSDKFYQFSSPTNHFTLDVAKVASRSKCLLLARKYYQEIQTEYPVENKKELIKIIKLELSAQPESVSLYQIGEYKNKKRIVTYALLNEQALTFLNETTWLFCIPESWLVGAVFNSQLVKVESQNDSYWLYSTAEKINSYPVKGLFKTSSAFCAAVGINNDEEPLSLSHQKVIDLFRTQSLKLLINNFKGMWVKKQSSQTFDLQILFPGLIAVVFSLLVYNYGVSFYLEYQLENQQVKQKELTKKSGELFSLQKIIQTKADKIAVLDKALFNSGVPLTVWQTLLPLYQDESLQFKSIVAFADNSVRVMVEAPKATKILELISNQPNVTNAQFYTDVVQIKKLERFTMSYTLSEAKEQLNNGISQ
ncbi:MAG: hypothetical protein JKY81_06890 [Colwellia sp.]|nr:hypothetical protein [Colwellia sp.]